MPECQGQCAHIHMAGTMQTVRYAAHHHPDSAFNPDLEKNITFFWLQQPAPSLVLEVPPNPWLHFQPLLTTAAQQRTPYPRAELQNTGTNPEMEVPDVLFGSSRCPSQR